jgi:hypothetical protein
VCAYLMGTMCVQTYDNCRVAELFVCVMMRAWSVGDKDGKEEVLPAPATLAELLGFNLSCCWTYCPAKLKDKGGPGVWISEGDHLCTDVCNTTNGSRSPCVLLAAAAAINLLQLTPPAALTDTYSSVCPATDGLLACHLQISMRVTCAVAADHMRAARSGCGHQPASVRPAALTDTSASVRPALCLLACFVPLANQHACRMRSGIRSHACCSQRLRPSTCLSSTRCFD